MSTDLRTAPEVRRTDRSARVSLPDDFADATVIVERVSETELRIRKAHVPPGEDVWSPEAMSAPLSDRDRDLFLSLLDNPPPPNEALRRALEDHEKRYG